MTFGRLPNPLDGFTSYSTHFILLACRTTEQARAFAAEADTTSLQQINSTSQLGAPVIFNGSDSDVFLVLDTRRFAQFSVERLRYEVLINGLQRGDKHGNLATEIQLTILDSVGISFINYLQWLMDSRMQCGFDGMVFMLRTLFVGHNQDGSSETVQSVTIPMHLFKLDVNLDYAKGAYDCVFMPNFNFSTNQHSRWLHIGTATNYSTGPGNTLGEMVDSFERSLNEDSADFYRTISAQLLQSGRAPASTRPGEFGRLVQYQLTIPEAWRSFIYTGPSMDKAIERAFTRANQAEQQAPAGKAVTPAQGSYLSVDPGQTITDVLEVMLAQVDGTRELANVDKLRSTDKFLTFYKFLVSVSSDKNSFTVHVDVIPFEVPNVVPPTNQAQPVSQHQARFYTEQVVDGVRLRRPTNYFELDYIYTGKNLDVLSFDLKLQDLQFLLASNVRVGEGELFSVAGKGQGDALPSASEPKPEIFNARQYDPILLPMLTKEQRANFSQYVTPRLADEQRRLRVNSQDYARNLSAFYAQSPIMVNAVIKGNPAIMEKFNLGSPVPHTSVVSLTATGISRTSSTVKGEYRRRLETEILRLPGAGAGRTSGTFTVNRPIGDAAYVTTPVFVKVNIKGPNVDPVTNELINGQDFATEVVYNGYYVVMKVVNVIERGVFTQELELWSHSVYGQGKLSAEQLGSKKADRA